MRDGPRDGLQCRETIRAVPGHEAAGTAISRSSSGPESSGPAVRSIGERRGTRPPTSAHPPAPLQILLVEDDEDNRAMYRQYLEWDGFRVVEATDGLQALRQAASLTLAAIVMDLALPRLDGWDVARRLKADPRTRHIPVLALTAHAFEDDAKRASAAGCDGYLAKPCLPEDLARAIRSLVQPTGGGGHRDRPAVIEGGRSRPGQGSGRARPSLSGARRERPSTSQGGREQTRRERAVGS